MGNNLPGVVDWGIGGLGLHSHLKSFDNRPILYYSDSGHSPVSKTTGDRSVGTLGSGVFA